MVHDLRPDVSWNKGESVLWLLERLGLVGPDVLPIYLGDDVTDEDAFAALAERGVGIVVRDGDGPSRARYSLRNEVEVRQFLEGLAAALQPQHRAPTCIGAVGGRSDATVHKR